jgi:hypothetical protein
MSTINQRIRRSLALATAVTALAAPAAWAAPVDPVVPGGAGDEVQNASYPSVDPSLLVVPSSPASAAETSSGDGFDWGDAGLGAGAMLGLTAMAAGTAVALRHRPRRGHRVA